MKNKKRKTKLSWYSRLVLRLVVWRLNNSSGQCGLFWDVISALRGPDVEYDYYATWLNKMATTAVIRGAVGVRPMSHKLVVESTDVWAARRMTTDFKSPHFVDHARGAFDALGLSWHEDNGEL